MRSVKYGIFILLCLTNVPLRAQVAPTWVHCSPHFAITHYGIHIQVHPAKRYLAARVEATIAPALRCDSLTLDFTAQLRVDSICLLQQSVSFVQRANHTLTLRFDKPLTPGNDYVLSFFYKGIPPVIQNADNDFGYAFITNTHNKKPVLFVVNEPYGTSGWLPCRNGLDAKVDSIDFFITHPKAFTASANGKLITRLVQGQWATTQFAHRFPIAPYLIAFAVSNYTLYRRTLPVAKGMQEFIYYTYPEDPPAFKRISAPLLRSFDLCTRLFGDYPFAGEPYSQTQVSGAGGMEHQGNSFVDGADIGLQNHELVHQWFGNKVSCSGWSHIWLKEGAAVWYADFLYPYYTGDSALYRQNVRETLRFITQKPNGAVWVRDSFSVKRLFDGRLSYAKAAFVYRMLQFELGDSAFFRGLRLYLEKFSGSFAGTAAMQDCMEQAGGKNLAAFFAQWIYGEGYPSFTLRWSRERDGDPIRIQLTQRTSHPSVPFFRMTVPVLLRGKKESQWVLISCEGKDTVLHIEAPGFEVKTVVIDPDNQMLTGKNTVIATLNK
jgi:aminopeptidase N